MLLSKRLSNPPPLERFSTRDNRLWRLAWRVCERWPFAKGKAAQSEHPQSLEMAGASAEQPSEHVSPAKWRFPSRQPDRQLLEQQPVSIITTAQRAPTINRDRMIQILLKAGSVCVSDAPVLTGGHLNDLASLLNSVEKRLLIDTPNYQQHYKSRYTLVACFQAHRHYKA